MRSVNRIALLGNMGEPPEVRETHGGQKVVQFVLATTRKWTTAGGEAREKTEWHRCVAWNGVGPQYADIVEKYGRKGLLCYVEGRLEYRSYDGRDGQKKWVTEVIVQEFVALDRPPAETRGTDKTTAVMG